MSTTTPNFGWVVPTSTDLVKDGASAIETLGDSIDASLVDLKGGTTGQVLSKNTNTDMDFTWVTPNDADAIQNTIMDAKGDLITATAADTPARLASSGVNGEVLTVDTSTATGLKWAASGSAALSLVASGSLSGTSVTLSSLSAYNDIWIQLIGAKPNSPNQDYFAFRVNNNSTTNYPIHLMWQKNGTSSRDSNASSYSQFIIGNSSENQVFYNYAGAETFIHLTNCKATGFTTMETKQAHVDNSGTIVLTWATGVYTVAETVSSIVLKWYTGTPTFAAGTYKVWAA